MVNFCPITTHRLLNSPMDILIASDDALFVVDDDVATKSVLIKRILSGRPMPYDNKDDALTLL